ncbi:HepT-like ribonuclease domain-containing protein [Thermodesulfobacteriota bacterium]
MRDIITHHYFDIDAETIFIVCSEHIPAMKNAINKIIADIDKNGSI